MSEMTQQEAALWELTHFDEWWRWDIDYFDGYKTVKYYMLDKTFFTIKINL